MLAEALRAEVDANVVRFADERAPPAMFDHDSCAARNRLTSQLDLGGLLGAPRRRMPFEQDAHAGRPRHDLPDRRVACREPSALARIDPDPGAAQSELQLVDGHVERGLRLERDINARTNSTACVS